MMLWKKKNDEIEVLDDETYRLELEHWRQHRHCSRGRGSIVCQVGNLSKESPSNVNKNVRIFVYCLFPGDIRRCLTSFIYFVGC